MGISYGQLYRWKRKGLIPESWFIRRFGIQVWFVVAGFLCIAVGISAFFIPAILHIEENHTANKERLKTSLS